jgi:hypothetical protein
MDYKDFSKVFNRVDVLLLLTDPIGEVWKKQVFNGEFKGDTAGGCSNNPTTFLNNPQYSLTVTQPTNVFVELSQPDLRYALKQNPSEYTKQYEGIGVTVLKDTSDQYKKVAYSQDDIVTGSDFVGIRDNCLQFTAQPGYHNILIPSTFHQGVEEKYWLSVYTEFPAEVHEITNVLAVTKLAGSWKDATAAGCRNNPAWLDNPQFLLDVDKAGTVIVALSQNLASDQQPQSIGFYIFARSTTDRISVEPQTNTDQPIVVPKSFINLPTVSQQFDADPSQHYIILPATFDPAEGDFSLSVSSPNTTIKTFAQLQ